MDPQTTSPGQTEVDKAPWEFYCEGVLSGNIPACETIKMACRRHLGDLDRQGTESFPYRFSRPRAERAIRFFRRLVLTKTMRAPAPFVPEPWQAFIVASLFGWLRLDGSRRFRKGLVMVPRKNGKSHLLAGIGLYGLVADGEYGAEVYSAATKKDQAKMIFDAATEFRRNSPDIRENVAFKNSTLSVMRTGSKFQALSSDEDGLDGLNVHVGLVDEFQNHKSITVYERIDTGTSARLQPLLLAIGTAGTDRLSPCGREHDLAHRILMGEARDETYFAFLAEADEGDDWESEATWRKCNPNLGVSKKLEYLVAQAQGARNDPGKLNGFKRLDLNMWTQQEYVYLPMNRWRLCPGEVRVQDQSGAATVVDPRDTAAVESAMLAQWRLPFAGLDLSSKDDITALANLFPPSADDARWVVTMRFWVPRDAVERRSKNDRVPYDLWIKEGWITATDGETVDYDFIKKTVTELHWKLHYQVVGFDPWQALMLTNQLRGEGLPMVEVAQTHKTLSDPTKELLAWTLSRKLSHLNNPVLNWMAGNMAVSKDVNGSVIPDKKHARERMDGISALVDAIYVALTRVKSAYSDRGVITI